MKAFVAPSILLSMARRGRGFSQGSGLFSDASIIRTVSRRGPRCNMMPSSKEWPLGLDPDNCKVADIRQQIRSRGYAPGGTRTKAGLLGELESLVRAESFAPPDSTIISDGAGAAAGSAQQRWSPDAGFVNRSTLEKGPNGFPLCRFCHEETSSVRRTFCSNGCVHEHKIRTQGSYVRKCLSVRDGGKCAECGFDAAGLYKRARKAWADETSLPARRTAVARVMAGTPFEGKVPREGATRRPPQGMFWHADHIVPVVRGGGQCSLKNYRTLCVPCHAKATKRLAGERAAERVGTAKSPAKSPSTVAVDTRKVRRTATARGGGRAIGKTYSTEGVDDSGIEEEREDGGGGERGGLDGAVALE